MKVHIEVIELEACKSADNDSYSNGRRAGLHWAAASMIRPLRTPHIAKLPIKCMGSLRIMDKCPTCGRSAQPQGEPVAWLYRAKLVGVNSETVSQQPPDRVSDVDLYDVTPLYTVSPAQAIPEGWVQHVEEWADRIDNCLAATEIPMRPELHVVGLSESMRLTLREMRAALAAAPKPGGEDE